MVLLFARNGGIIMDIKEKLMELLDIMFNGEYCIDKTIFTSASSIGFAFDKELPKYEIAEGKEGFSLIKVNNSISIENIMI